ncbi:hypothetical protein D3C87_1391130 [compost metagenome]
MGNCSASAVGAGPKKPPMALHSNSCITSKRSTDGAAATHTYSGYTIRKNARVNAISTGRRPRRSDSAPDNGMTTVITATASICTSNT